MGQTRPKEALELESFKISAIFSPHLDRVRQVADRVHLDDLVSVLPEMDPTRVMETTKETGKAAPILEEELQLSKL